VVASLAARGSVDIHRVEIRIFAAHQFNDSLIPPRNLALGSNTCGELVTVQLTVTEMGAERPLLEKLPSEYVCMLSISSWAILNIFIRFLNAIVTYNFHRIFPRIAIIEISKRDLINRFINELSFYSGIAVFARFLEQEKQPQRVESWQEVEEWAREFEAREFTGGQRILPVNGEQSEEHLVLSSNLGAKQRFMFGPILRLQNQQLDVYDKSVFEDILTLQGILPAAVQRETTLVKALRESQVHSLKHT
jgi:hypothetical protein